jgi:hypothetical protein
MKVNREKTQSELDEEIPHDPKCSVGADPGLAPDGLPAEQPGPVDYSPPESGTESRDGHFPPMPAPIGGHVSAPTTFKPIS